MTFPFDEWKFVAGLGLFLFGLQLVEASLKYLSGRHFKKFIQKHTKNTFKSILVGTVSTMILQSSSAVTLMLLALVGSGVLAFSNALGIILGANLGTTFTGWVVSTFGFEVDIEKGVLPIIAIGALLHVFFASRRILSDWGKFLLGLGLLFYGIFLMKDSVSLLQSAFNIESISNYNIYIFAIGGFIFTAIIQSSSASMVIALTALNANLLSLEAAAALIVGAELGTTVTTILGATGGTPEKKRVAAAHFLFNLVTGVLALLFLSTILSFVNLIIGEDSPLYSLVFFQSSVNLLGIFIFWPFLGTFSKFLERRFLTKEENGILLDINPEHPESAIEALLESARRFAHHSMAFNLSIVNVKNESSIKDALKLHLPQNFLKKYSELKLTEATLVDYAIRMQKEGLSEEQSQTLQHILSGIRNLGFSRKSLKDIRHNLEEFNNSSNDLVHDLSERMTECFYNIYKSIREHVESDQPSLLSEGLALGLNQNEEGYQDFIQRINEMIRHDKIPHKYISNLFNVDRELHASNKFLIFAIGDIWLAPEHSDYLVHLPQNNADLKSYSK